MIPPRPEVLSLSEAIHGAVNRTELAALGIDPKTVLDFSACVNPLGPSLRVVEALSKSSVENYPDRDATEFRAVLAVHLNIPTDCLIAGNGSSELLSLIALAYLRPHDTALIVGPTYSEYARVCAMMGATVKHCDARPESNFQLPSPAVEDSLHTLRPRVVFVCHPNNPTGQCIPADTLQRWVDAFPQTLFVVDEAYIEFARSVASFVSIRRDNLVVLRSMTKAYGLAGLRLGYAVSTPDVISVLCRVRPPWSVNSLAQAAGIAALSDTEHLRGSVAALHSHKEWMLNALMSVGHIAYPSLTHFFLLRVANAGKVRRRLLESRILVRDCTSFGLPDALRISPRTMPENTLLCEALKRTFPSM